MLYESSGIKCLPKANQTYWNNTPALKLSYFSLPFFVKITSQKVAFLHVKKMLL